VVCLGMVCLFTNSTSVIQTFNDCDRCLDKGNIVCRKRIVDTMSFCCDVNQGAEAVTQCSSTNPKTRANYAICSNEFSLRSMKYFSCPYEDKFCGNDGQSAIRMSPGDRNATNPGNHTVISVADRRFRNHQQCYY